MWQFQWMLSLIPESLLLWVYYAFISVGLVAYIGSKFFKRFPFKYIPFLGQYPLLAELLGIASLCLGLFLYGGYAVEMAWRDKVSEVEAKVEIAKKESEEANTKLEAKSKEKQKVRIEYYNTVKERIVEKEKLIDAKCELDPEVPKLINAAARNPMTKGTVTIEEVKK
jgi:hypothetical protein